MRHISYKMKLGAVTPYINKTQKIYESSNFAHADISIFLLEINKFYYIKKYKCRLSSTKFYHVIHKIYCICGHVNKVW